MADVPTHLLLATFNEEKSAKEACKSLKRARSDNEVAFHDAAHVKRDDKNRLHIKESGDIKPGKGAAVGGMLGASIGLLAGPAGFVLGGSVGAMIGAAASAADSGISDYRLDNIGDRLMLGTSAILAVADDIDLERVKLYLQSHGADVVSQIIDPDIASLTQTNEE